MRAAVALPVTVKMRIGVLVAGGQRAAELGRFERAGLSSVCDEFTATVAQAGCRSFHRACAQGGARWTVAAREPRRCRRCASMSCSGCKQDFPAALDRGEWRPADGGAVPARRWAGRMVSCSVARPTTARSVLAELHAALFDDGWQAPAAGSMLERMADYAEREVRAGERRWRDHAHMLGLCCRAARRAPLPSVSVGRCAARSARAPGLPRSIGHLLRAAVGAPGR